MTSAFQGGRFEPEQSPDYVPALQYNYNLINRGEQSFYEASRANDRKRVEIAGQDVTGLVDFAPTLLKLVGNIENDRKKRKIGEGYNLYFTQGFSKEDSDALDVAEERMAKANIDSTKLSTKHEEDGGDFRTSERFRQLSKYQQYGYVRAYVEEMGSKYFIPNEINDEQDEAKRQGLIEDHRVKYLSQFEDINPGLLNKYLFPQMKDTEKRNNREWTNIQTDKLTTARIEEGSTHLYNGILGINSENPGRGTEAVVEYVQQMSNLRGWSASKAKDEAVKLIGGMLDDGDIDGETVDLILDTEFKAHDGSTQSIRKYWGRQFKRLVDKAKDASYQNLQSDQRAKQVEAAAIEDEVREIQKAKEEDNELISESTLTEKNEEYRKLTGSYSNFISNTLSAEDRNDYEDNKTLEKLRINRGFVVKADLDDMSFDIKKKWMPQVEADKSLAAENPYKEYSKTRITGLVNEATSLGAMDRNDSSYGLALEQATIDYEALRQEFISVGETPYKAHQLAIEEVQKNFLDRDGKMARSSEDSKYFQQPDLTDTTKDLKLMKSSMEILDQFSNKEGKKNYLSSTVLPGTKDLIEQASKYAVGNGDIPYFYKYLADSIPGIQAWDIVDSQLKAAGHEGLGEKHPIDSTLEITGLEDLKRKLGYKVNRSSINQAKLDVVDARAIADLEEVGDLNPYTSVFNLDTSLMFDGIINPNIVPN